MLTYAPSRQRLANGMTVPVSDDNIAEAFLGKVKLALKVIEGFKSGAEMIGEIESARPTLYIIRAAPGVMNKCTLQRETVAEANNVCYAEIINPGKLQEKLTALINGNQATLSFEVKRAGAKLKKFSQPPYAEARAAHSQIDKHETDKRFRAEPSNDVLRRGVLDMQVGIIGYWMMEVLQPGPGADAYVVWDPDHLDSRVTDGNNAPVAWSKRPAWLGLAHELIHGWRMVTGRCVFRPTTFVEDYYEEAMTVGLPPYDRCKYTENLFRTLAKEPRRSFYGPSTKERSDKALLKAMASAM